MNSLHKSLLIYINLFFLILVFGCEDNIHTECGPISPTNPIENTTFTSIQKDVFDQSCATAGCHSATSPAANLTLTDGNSYSNLVNVTSLVNPSFNRVEPGNSSDSFLIKMLKNSGDRSSMMPPSGKLENSVIDSIAAWIDRGALNN